MRVRIDKERSEPAYEQIVNAVLAAIEQGVVHVGDPLPPVERIMQDCGVARATAIKAFSLLKGRGLVVSRPRKGYYVASASVHRQRHVLLLFDAFTPYKEALYRSLQRTAPEGTYLDIYFHHFRPELFQAILRDGAANHDAFVIMPFRHEGLESALGLIDAGGRLLLDRSDAALPGIPHIWQDFDGELVGALMTARDRLAPYRRASLIFPPDRHHPATIPSAFRRFCRHTHLDFSIHPHYTASLAEKETLLFVIEDEDLVTTVEDARRLGLTIGRDLGILSYNDTPMKRVIGQGIDAVSIDFERMGRLTAEWLRTGTVTQTVVPTRLIARGSV